MSENPIISVITVVKNGENFIKNCMESVKNQNTKNIEHIIIDGKSNDHTVQIIKKNLMSYTKFISELDTGLYDAMNKGLKMAKGEFIHFLNADDIYFESKSLNKVIKKLDKNFISHGLMMYNKSNGNKKILGEKFSLCRELKASRMPQPVMVVPKYMYESVGYFNTSYKIAADYDMVFRLTMKYPTKFLDIIITKMSAGGISYKNNFRAFQEARNISQLYGRNKILSLLDYYIKVVKWIVYKYIRIV